MPTGGIFLPGMRKSQQRNTAWNKVGQAVYFKQMRAIQTIYLTDFLVLLTYDVGLHWNSIELNSVSSTKDEEKEEEYEGAFFERYPTTLYLLFVLLFDVRPDESRAGAELKILKGRIIIADGRTGDSIGLVRLLPRESKLLRMPPYTATRKRTAISSLRFFLTLPPPFAPPLFLLLYLLNLYIRSANMSFFILRTQFFWMEFFTTIHSE